MKRFGIKFLSAFIAIVMGAFSCSVVMAQEETAFEVITPEEAAQEETASEEAEEIFTHLEAASATHMNGNFFTDLWGYNTSDLDVQSLLNGYNLVMWNGTEGMFGVDPSVVSGITVMENADGDHSYVLNLYDDLYFSDGTRITAWDYAFTWLLLCSDEIGELGVIPEDLSFIKGFEEYKDGTLPYLEGIRVTADDTLTVIADHESLPYFYELGRLSCVPYPIQVIAPGVKVFDDGSGVYLANDPEWEEEAETAEPAEPESGEAAAEEAAAEETVAAAEEPPRFTSDLLRETILDPETGYLSHPCVVSGPYVLSSWDGETAEFEANPFYKGDAKGARPTIDTLSYRCLANEDMIKSLEEGKIGLLNKVTNAETIMEGMDLISDPAYGMSNYARTGLTFISFSRTSETVASKAVRQAIAWCMDRDELLNRYAGNFGIRMDGYYGVGQWMYSLAIGNTTPPEEAPEDENDAAAQAEYEARLAAWEEINLDELTRYTLDIETAKRLLEEDCWILNEDGIREKDGVLLDLSMIYPEGSRIREAFEELLIPNLEKVGIELTLYPVPLEELLEMYYEQTAVKPEREMAGEEAADPDDAATPDETAGSEAQPAEIPKDPDMIYLGSNFVVLFEPEDLFSEYADEPLPEEESDPRFRDYAGIREAAIEMNRTKPGDILAYMQKWVRLQKQINDCLPMIPIYSNVYFDFYTSALQGYNIEENITWGNAVLGAKLAEPETKPEPASMPDDPPEALLPDEELVEFDD